MEVEIDNVKGWGAVPDNQEIDYKGLRVLMKPSMFLKLAFHTESKPSQEMIDHVRKGGSFGAPFLDFDMPEPWVEDDDVQEGYIQITGHEGRHRMKAIMAAEGDDPVEVHMFPKYYRNRHLTDTIKSRMNQGAYAERTRQFISGPLFKEM